MKLKNIFRRKDKDKESEKIHQEDLRDDFAELEDQELSDPIDEDSTESGIEDDFDEIGFLESLEEDSFNDLPSVTEGDNSDELDDSDDSEIDDYEEELLDPLWHDDPYEDWDSNESTAEEDTESVSSSQPQEKHVTFIPIDEYQDISYLDEIIERNRQMVSNNELIKRLNVLEKDKSDMEKLDQIKKEYVVSRIQSPEIQNLTQKYVDDIDMLIEDTKLNLAEAHDKVLTTDYEAKAIDLLEPEIDEAESQYQRDIANYEEKEEETYQTRLENFIKKQESELEVFKREQEQELLNFEEEQSYKKKTNIDLFESEREEQFIKQKEKILTEGIYKQEQIASSELSPFKRTILGDFESELKEASTEMKSQLEEHLNQIRKEIDEKEHEWKTEIHQEELRLEQQRLREIEERRLAIQEEELNLKREKQEQEYQFRDDQLHKENERLEEELRESQLTHSEMNKLLVSHLLSQTNPIANGNLGINHQDEVLNDSDNSKNEEGQKKNKKKSESNKKLIVGSATVLLGITLIGGTLLKGCENSNHFSPGDLIEKPKVALIDENEVLDEGEKLGTKINQESVVEAADDKTPNKEESEDIKETEEDSFENEVEEFEALIAKGDFEEAIKLVEPNEALDLDLLTNEMRKQGALVELVNFNQSFDTNYGKLDELILKDDIWGVFNVLLALPEELLLKMSSNRRNDVVHFLYQHDFISFGNWVLESRENNE